MADIDFSEQLRTAAGAYRAFAESTDPAVRERAVRQGTLALVGAAAALVEGLDADERATQLPQLKAQVETEALRLADELGAKLLARTGIKYAIGPAVEALAGPGEQVKLWLRAKVLPAAKGVHEWTGAAIGLIDRAA